MSEAPRASADSAVLVPADVLTGLTRTIFARAGLPEAHAALVADVLVWADLRGMDSHGVLRVPRYVEMIGAGDLNPTPRMTTRTEALAAVVLEADRAAGPVAMTAAMDAALDKARQAGVGLALVRSTTHTAALGYYTLMAARAGMAAIALSGSGPNMAYHGAGAAGVSTAPISIAVPGGDLGPLVLDMGTGLISMGKLMHARKTGGTIPAGWALDGRGQPTTDGQAARLPLPLGGPKGSGLSLMIECITSLVVGNPLLAEALERTPAGRRHRQNGLALAIDLARFCDAAAFRREVDRLVAAVKALPRAPGVLEILMPGERGHRTFTQRSRDGIPLPRPIFEELKGVAEGLGVTLPAGGMFPSRAKAT
jgi:LDH2 family malate/lactate/ureidoglycolate dehydrogenase